MPTKPNFGFKPPPRQMRTFRVFAETISSSYIEVVAESSSAAVELAHDAVPEDFTDAGVVSRIVFEEANPV